MPRDRAERIALTEAAFRIANERMAGWEERQRGDDVASYFCECASEGCREEVRLSRPQYEAVRAEPRRFVVLHDHIIEDLEIELERFAAYSVIEKPAALTSLLEDTDSRGRIADDIASRDGD